MSSRRVGLALALAGPGVLVGGLAAGQSTSTNKPAFAHLQGKNEIGANGKKGAGDANGQGSATVYVAGSKVCFGLTVYRIQDPTMAHIHRGGPNRNGTVVVPLTPPASGNPGASGGCVNVASATATAIRRNPSRYYVNVHTGDFAGGAVRGQLFTVPRR